MGCFAGSGGASGSTILPLTQRKALVRRYGIVRRRAGGNLRYHEYSFKDRRGDDYRIYHTLPCKPRLGTGRARLAGNVASELQPQHGLV
jgi:hypothetical protein